MALTEKSFNQVKSILNRLDRSIDDLRARRGSANGAGSPQGSPASPAPSTATVASQNHDRRATANGAGTAATNGTGQVIGAPSNGAGQRIGAPTNGNGPLIGGAPNGASTLGHANGSGQTAPQRPGAQFGRATPILPRQGSSHQ